MQLQRVLNLNSIDCFFFLQSCFWYCSGTVVMGCDSELCSALVWTEGSVHGECFPY